MKILALIALCATALLAGCDSLSDRMQDRFTVVPPKAQTFAAPLVKVYPAAQLAFKRLDFILTRTKVGQIEAVSRINSSAALADARQMVAKVHLTESALGQTDVEINLTEEVTSTSFGGTHQQSMKDHSFFALYYATLQQILQDQARQPVSAKP